MHRKQAMSLIFHLLIKTTEFYFLKNIMHAYPTLVALLGKTYFILVPKGITVQR